jgi:hypothetical protein
MAAAGGWMEPAEAGGVLDYKPRAIATDARRRGARCLIVAAVLLLMMGAGLPGVECMAWFDTSRISQFPSVSWSFDPFKRQVWGENAAAAAVHLGTCAAGCVVVVLTAWGVRRRKRRLTAVGMILCTLIGLLLLLGAVTPAMFIGEMLMNGSGAVTDFVGIGVTSAFWSLMTACALLRGLFLCWRTRGVEVRTEE